MDIVTGTATPPAPTSTLTAADRCDRCGAPARVRVLLATGELVFCRHHAKAFEPALRPCALQWLEEAEALG